MSDSDALFETTPVKLMKGEAVKVQTIWGAENGVVVDVMSGPGGWPVAQVLMELGDTISIDVARVRKRSAL